MSVKHILGALFAVAVAGGAQAAPGYCSNTADGSATTHTDNIVTPSIVLSTADVNYSITGAAPYTNSNDCYGIQVGLNPNQTSETNFVNGLSVWGGGFTYLDKSDSTTGASLLGLTWTLTAGSSGTGSYTLSTNSAISPAQYFDFVVLMKAASGHVAYYFDEVKFDGAGGGQWTVKIPNNGNNGGLAGLSHMTVFGRTGSTPPDGTTPEPGTLALAGLALLAVGYARRRQRG